MEVIGGIFLAVGYFGAALFFVWLALWFERNGL